MDIRDRRLNMTFSGKTYRKRLKARAIMLFVGVEAK